MGPSHTLVRIGLKVGTWVLASQALGCGLLATQRDVRSVKSQQANAQVVIEEQRQEIARLRGDLEATRERLDTALRANAEGGQDRVVAKQRLNDVAGRSEELSHQVDELRKELAASRQELYGRLDELKPLGAKGAPMPPTIEAPAPPATLAPADKQAHLEAIQAAHARKDWGAVRGLGLEYVNRYSTDDKADDALYLVANADLQDGRASSALGNFNRLLKVFPKTNTLDKTLFDMGEAYLALKDCKNARAAFVACETRYGKERVGADAKRRIASIDKPTAGMCAPQ